MFTCLSIWYRRGLRPGLRDGVCQSPFLNIRRRLLLSKCNNEVNESCAVLKRGQYRRWLSPKLLYQVTSELGSRWKHIKSFISLTADTTNDTLTSPNSDSRSIFQWTLNYSPQEHPPVLRIWSADRYKTSNVYGSFGLGLLIQRFFSEYRLYRSFHLRIK